MQRLGVVGAIALLLFLATGTVHAHFGGVIPSQEVVTVDGNHHLRLTYQFFHPFDQAWMDLARPRRVGYYLGGEDHSLQSLLKPVKIHGHGAWQADLEIRRPGDYMFYMVPAPYWEPAEDVFIQHVTKVVVNAFGLEDGWDRPLGLPAEIVPTVRPYGLWAGNLFCGRVLMRGKPAPGVRVEVEYLNDAGVQAPKPVYSSQVLTTDEKGGFCYAMPRAGWWGFAALKDEEGAMVKDGKRVPLELGAVIWVRTREMK